MKKTAYVFDLGGVLIKLDVPRCMRAFVALMGEKNMQAVLGMDSRGEGVKAVSMATKQLMADFERGLIAKDAFLREELRYCNPGTTEEQVLQAWMSMLDELPAKRLAVVDDLRAKGHPVYLLSNGNDLHFDYINQTFGLSRHFDALFLSQKMHMSKPEQQIFEAVDKEIRSRENGELEVVFIDDIEANRKAAERFVGWTTVPDVSALTP